MPACYSPRSPVSSGVQHAERGPREAAHELLTVDVAVQLADLLGELGDGHLTYDGTVQAAGSARRNVAVTEGRYIPNIPALGPSYCETLLRTKSL